MLWNANRLLNINGARVKVRFLDGRYDRDLDFGASFGVCIPPNGHRDYYQIKINTARRGVPVPESEQRDTLLHELIHLSNLADERSACIPERVVKVLSRDLLLAFAKYPELARWLTKNPLDKKKKTR